MSGFPPSVSEDSTVVELQLEPVSKRAVGSRLKHANKDIVVVKVEAQPELPANAVELEEICRRLKQRERFGVVQELKQTRVKVNFNRNLRLHTQ